MRSDLNDELRAIGAELLAAAREAQAYGIAAAHIGHVAPVVVIGGTERGDGHRVLYNARIVDFARETTKGEEGSVSLPGVRVEVERPVWAEIEWQEEDGSLRKARLEGFEARVAIHEIEQMQGIFFLQRVSRLRREMLLKKLRKR